MLAFAHGYGQQFSEDNPGGSGVFGVFHSLFGLASNELYLVLFNADAAPDIGADVSVPGPLFPTRAFLYKKPP